MAPLSVSHIHFFMEGYEYTVFNVVKMEFLSFVCAFLFSHGSAVEERNF